MVTLAEVVRLRDAYRAAVDGAEERPLAYHRAIAGRAGDTGLREIGDALGISPQRVAAIVRRIRSTDGHRATRLVGFALP